MKFEIHFEFRASLRKFQDLNFWDATKEQLADIFTKPLDEKPFIKLRNELNILDSRNFD
jgi:hypothetical protein